MLEISCAEVDSRRETNAQLNWPCAEKSLSRSLVQAITREVEPTRIYVFGSSVYTWQRENDA
jgi:hypothetical protein